MADLQIIEMKTEDLTPYTNNAKQHPEEQIAQIMESIQEFGMNDPIAVWGARTSWWKATDGWKPASASG